MTNQTIRVGETTVGRLPPIGLGMPDHQEPLSGRERELLRRLAPDHLRQDLHLGAANWAADLDRAQRDAEAIGCGLELALLSEDPPSPGKSLAEQLARGPEVRVFDLLTESVRMPTTAWLDAARAAAGAPGQESLFALGSNANFTELNRDWDSVRGAPAVVYPVTPQVHASDDRSLIETLPMQGLTVRTAAARASGSAVLVSPITLKQRFNPLAAGPTRDQPGLPASVDHRQMSLLAGAWTLGSVAGLALAGATSCTYFESVGWKGVLERDRGSPMPDHFPSRPRMVFPIYHVLADILQAKHGDVLDVEIPENDPPWLAALALRTPHHSHLLVANLTPSSRRVTVQGLAGIAFDLRTLDDRTALLAAFDPARFRTAQTEVRGAVLQLDLGPYAFSSLRSRSD